MKRMDLKFILSFLSIILITIIYPEIVHSQELSPVEKILAGKEPVPRANESNGRSSKKELLRTDEFTWDSFDYAYFLTNRYYNSVEPITGLLSESICWYFNWSGDSTLYSKLAKTYDSQQRETSRITSFWKNNQWENDTKYEFEFSPMGKETGQYLYKWVSNNWQIIGGRKWAYTYDNVSGLLTSLTYSTYTNGNWNIDDRQTHQYNGNGHRTATIYESAYSGSLTLSYKVEFDG
ncbi:MAG: hypothetical protein H0X62_11480 [Bacteroidetes bacterium]|nr:hypothetical protein [Bacteroidota bacterium]